VDSTNTPSDCEGNCKLKGEVVFSFMVAKMVIFDANMACPRAERRCICRFITAIVILKDG
jgi:hypothetical protein